MDIKTYLNKAAQYCARYETCIFDLRQKLFKWKVPQEFHDQIIDYLLKNEFINEKRYAHSFVHDKFFLNGWGKRKIIYLLEQKHIPHQFISKALEQIDDQSYKDTLKKILLRKKTTIKSNDTLSLRQKLITFATGRGYEPEIVYLVVDELLKSES